MRRFAPKSPKGDLHFIRFAPKSPIRSECRCLCGCEKREVELRLNLSSRTKNQRDLVLRNNLCSRF